MTSGMERCIENIPILLYHGISDDIPPNDRYKTTVSTRRFERQMRFLFDRRYRSISLADLFRASGSGTVPDENFFALTFDDGNEDFYSRAFPILRRFRFTATVFLVTDQIGKRGLWEGAQGSRLLTWDQVLALRDEGISFGSHTCTHRRLTGMSSEEARHEMVRSRVSMENRLGRKVEFLAYPFGDSDAGIQSMAEEAGYSGACGVLNGRWNRYNLMRREIHSVDSMLSFRLKLTPFHRVPNLLRRKTAMGRMLDRFALTPLQPSDKD